MLVIKTSLKKTPSLRQWEDYNGVFYFNKLYKELKEIGSLMHTYYYLIMHTNPSIRKMTCFMTHIQLISSNFIEFSLYFP